jgi:hypothetical protein
MLAGVAHALILIGGIAITGVRYVAGMCFALGFGLFVFRGTLGLDLFTFKVSIIEFSF